MNRKGQIVQEGGVFVREREIEIMSNDRICAPVVLSRQCQGLHWVSVGTYCRWGHRPPARQAPNTMTCPEQCSGWANSPIRDSERMPARCSALVLRSSGL